jgi:hypothetical protein
VKRTKRQHVVPRCYLKRFCKDGEGFFAFDKGSRKSFPANVMNVAQQRFFYDIPGDLLAKACLGPDIDSQFVEKAFAQMEGVVNPLITEIIETADRRGVITPQQRVSLAPYVIIQSLRTGLMRDLILETNEKQMQAMADAIVRKNFPDVPEDHYPRIEYNRDLLPIVQAQRIFDEDHVVEMAVLINRHIWFIGINDTPQPYYTSDHPVVKKANVHRPGRSFNGWRSPGIEISFPLSSHHLLVMVERNHFRHLGWLDGKARRMDASGVKHFNEQQVLKCYRQVFCETDQFDLAAEVCCQHPEACAPNRPRVRVVQTEDTIGLLFDD